MNAAKFKLFFGPIDAPMKTMAYLLDMERAPAEIMRLPRSQWLPRSVMVKS